MIDRGEDVDMIQDVLQSNQVMKQENLVHHREHAKNLCVKSCGLKTQYGLGLNLIQHNLGLGNPMTIKRRSLLNSLQNPNLVLRLLRTNTY